MQLMLFSLLCSPEVPKVRGYQHCSAHSVSSNPQSHSSPSSTILLPQKAPLFSSKQLVFLSSTTASSTALIFLTEHGLNLLLLSLSPLVALANMIKFPRLPPGLQSAG